MSTQTIIPSIQNTLAIEAPTVGALVASDIRNAEVFKKFGIDFCCGGKQTLEEACRQAGVNPEEVRLELDRNGSVAYQPAHKFSEWPLDFLADYIYNTHHQFIRENAKELDGLATKVAARHGAHHPELKELAYTLQQFLEDMLGHLEQEEGAVFPYIKQLVAKKKNPALAWENLGSSLQSPVRQMEVEHQASGEDLSFFRKLTNNYTLPEGACNSYALLFQQMKAFEEDLLQHIHLENNILFPKALELENHLLH